MTAAIVSLVAGLAGLAFLAWAAKLVAQLVADVAESGREQARLTAELLAKVADTLHAEVVPPPLEQHSEVVAAPVQRPDWAEPVIDPYDPTDDIEGLRDEDIGQRPRAVVLKSWERASP